MALIACPLFWWVPRQGWQLIKESEQPTILMQNAGFQQSACSNGMAFAVAPVPVQRLLPFSGLRPLQALAKDLQALEEADGAVEELVGVPPTEQLAIVEWIRGIRIMLRSLGDGAISGSPYDAAWVAMIPALDGTRGPQFKAALDWVRRSQLPDGCWAGDTDLFNVYDRLVATLASVVVLRTWSQSPDAVRRGCAFISRHLHIVEEDKSKIHRTVGFEMVFPALLERARRLGLDLPYDAPVTATILRERERKLKQIPLDSLQSHPTTLLASLEGMDILEGIQWDEILKLQSPAGHMLTSPASTACLYMHTGDTNALRYLTRLVEETSGVIPNHSPVDIFERLWVVDRLQRLGISRYFKREIKGILDFAYERWTSKGLSWATDCQVTDLDDTSMGFRLLRQHGYPVSADVFNAFVKEDDFSCWTGHGCNLDTDLTPMFNLYRASEMRFPEETVLEDAWEYTRRHLQDKLRLPQLSDKWVVAKDMRGELEYAINSPWYASLPRLETRAYIDQYGPDDVWIAKSLYRMYGICNPEFLSLAKADYNVCQRLHRMELEELKGWMTDCNFDHLPFARHHTVIPGYMCVAATAFEPQMAAVRRARVQLTVLVTIAGDYIASSGASQEELNQFLSATKSWDPSMIDHSNKRQRIVFMGIYDSITEIATKASEQQGRDVSNHVIAWWQSFMESVRIREDWKQRGVLPTWDEFIPVGATCVGMEVCSMPTCFLIPGVTLTDQALADEFQDLTIKASTVARLVNDIRSYESGIPEVNSMCIHMRDHPEDSEEEAAGHLRAIADSTMQEVVQHVLSPGAAPLLPCKNVFLQNTKFTYYLYTDNDGWSSPSKRMDHDFGQLLFNRVE